VAEEHQNSPIQHSTLHKTPTVHREIDPYILDSDLDLPVDLVELVDVVEDGPQDLLAIAMVSQVLQLIINVDNNALHRGQQPVQERGFSGRRGLAGDLGRSICLLCLK